MNNFYKPSMFNYSCADNDQLILYNSFMGTRSIMSVSNGHKSEVKELLARDRIENDNSNNIITVLIERGFLVPLKENEKLKRDFLFRKLLMIIHWI